jgi:ABC-type phosphate/phosphonate transport system permease subunit
MIDRLAELERATRHARDTLGELQRRVMRAQRPPPSLAYLAIAAGAFAIGAFAVGALAIGRLTIGRARIKRLEVDELVVNRLEIKEQVPPPAGDTD